MVRIHVGQPMIPMKMRVLWMFAQNLHNKRVDGVRVDSAAKAWLGLDMDILAGRGASMSRTQNSSLAMGQSLPWVKLDWKWFASAVELFPAIC